MKTALFYSIARNPYGNDWRVVVVTTMRKDGKVRWWGRTADDDAKTSGRGRDLRGRFTTEDDARATLADVQAIERSRRAEITRLAELRSKADRRFDRMVEDILASCRARLPDAQEVMRP